MKSLKYKQYTAEEFADDKDFWLWVLKEEESLEAFWQQFMAENPDKTKEIEQARAIVLQVNTEKYKLEHRKVNALWERIQSSKAEIDKADNSKLVTEQKEEKMAKG